MSTVLTVRTLHLKVAYSRRLAQLLELCMITVRS